MGLVPLAWGGKEAFSWLVASWLLVPGRDRLSFVLSPIRCETATSAIVATNHTPSTTNRRRTHIRATACSIPVTSVPSFPCSSRRVPGAVPQWSIRCYADSHLEPVNAIGRPLDNPLGI